MITLAAASSRCSSSLGLISNLTFGWFLPTKGHRRALRSAYFSSLRWVGFPLRTIGKLLTLTLGSCSDSCPSSCSLNVELAPLTGRSCQLSFCSSCCSSSARPLPRHPTHISCAMGCRLMALALDSCSDYCSSSFIQTVPFVGSAGSLAFLCCSPTSSFLVFCCCFCTAAALVIVPFPCCGCSLAAAPSGCCTRCCCSLRWFCGLSLRLFFFAADLFVEDDVALYGRPCSSLCTPFR